MEQTYNILLNSSKNKKSVNENTSLNVALSGNRILLPEEPISDTLNSYDIYLDERKRSNKFRLILDIEPYCTNVLFNPFTEIVRNEGSSSAICLNFLDPSSATTEYIETNIIQKPAVIAKTKPFVWTAYEAIRDTQFSNETCGFEYHCGIDIFNNHILRNKTFKAVNFNEENSYETIGVYSTSKKYNSNYYHVRVNDLGLDQSHWHVYIDDNFNTIDDYMRDRDGVIVSEHFPKIVKKTETTENVTRASDGNNGQYNLENVILPLHLYQNYDTMTYDECVENKLIEDNGWYGFSNPSILWTLLLKEGVHTVKTDSYSFGVSTEAITCPKEDVVVDVYAFKTTNTENLEATKLSINKTINNREYCDFIDMYPGRDLYSFSPKYNYHRKRLEKNWNYCLTYPSKSIIRMYQSEYSQVDFPFFRIDNSGNTSLKVYMFDEGTFDDNENPLLTIYTVCQHGLSVGDMVNIYKTDDLFYESAEVVNIVDKYIFQVPKDTGNMSQVWLEVENRNVTKKVTNPVTKIITGSSETEAIILSGDQKIVKGMYKIGNAYYPICESNRCNIDPTAQDIHIRRVLNDVECKYYVRTFSRLPNFKYKDEEVNDYTLYDDHFNETKKKKRRSFDTKNLPLIKRFSNPGDNTCDFENHISKIGFANTAYGDDSTEIVFTDDIDISYLRDNLGRPVSDIFLTIVKNNKGYKEWYGIGNKPNLSSVNIEYSHCFGKVNGSFLLSDYFRESYLYGDSNTSLYDVRDLTSDPTKKVGLFTCTEDVTKSSGYEDEIEFERDWDYNGDICCYSPVDCDEQIIQTAMHRFNTVQRELHDIKNNYTFAYFRDSYKEPEDEGGTLYYDEIKDDENTIIYEKTDNGDPYNLFKNGSENRKRLKEILSTDTNLYHTTKEKRVRMMEQREGYYYQPHSRIPFKVVSKEVSSDPAIEHEIVETSLVGSTENGRVLFEVKTSYGNDFLRNDKVVLYKRSTNQLFYMTVYEPLSPYRFTCVIADEQGNHVSDIDGFTDISQIDDFVILEKHPDTPDYAKLIKDTSCRYYWREVISNGIEDDPKVYPFTNGAFYVTQKINFFLRRQDPKKENLGKIIKGDAVGGLNRWDYNPDGEDIKNYPNFIPDDKTNYNEEEIESC